MNLEELYKKAIVYARYRKNNRDAYDFASWIVLKVLENKYKSLNLRTAYIDYLRHMYGSKQKKSFNKRQIFNNFVPLDESKYSYPEVIEPIDYSLYVNPKYRETYRLAMQEGYTLKEIAKIRDITEGRVSQILKMCKKDIFKNVIKA